LAVIEKLGSSLKKIESNIKIRLDKLHLKKFDCSFLIDEVSTDNQKIIETLSQGTDINLVRSFQKLNDDQLADLTSFEEKILKLKSEDPKKIIAENIKNIARFNVVKAKLNEIQSFLNLDTTDNIKSLSNNLKTKKELRDSSTKETFSNIEFSNVGSDIWKELWLAAKKFIEEGKGVFPDNKEGAKCPLCIQDLSPKATDRFKTFESYLKEKFEQEYSEARIALGVQYKAIKNLKFTFPDLEETEKDLKKEI